MKKKSNSMWKAVFIPLLIIHLGLGYWIIPGIINGRYTGFGFLGVLPFLGLISLIDLIVVSSYIITQHPQGIIRDISYAALIPICLMLMYVVYVFV